MVLTTTRETSMRRSSMRAAPACEVQAIILEPGCPDSGPAGVATALASFRPHTSSLYCFAVLNVFFFGPGHAKLLERARGWVSRQAVRNRLCKSPFPRYAIYLVVKGLSDLQ